jgi:hypothetical protein
MSYDKCLQMWTKQIEQRRSHQRVKRWQEFLQRMKPGDAESGESGGAERQPSSSPPQQWIRSRAKRKASAPTDGQKSESDGSNTTKERKRKRRTKGREGEKEDDGRRGREDAKNNSPPEKKEQEERPRSWDFHILQADDIRDQQEGGGDDHHGSSPAT